MCEAVWRQLRRPFVMGPASAGFHECRWEVFDMGVAGCLSCGLVHRCAPAVCKQVVQTEDAGVCVITGYCVHSHNLVSNEFDDTAMLRRKPSGVAKLLSLDFDEIDTHIHALLTSALSRAAHDLEISKLVYKFRSHVGNSTASQPCIFEVIAAGMRKTQSSRVLTTDFRLRERELLAATVSPHIKFLIAQCVRRQPAMLRGLDTRTLVFGMLYLMRTGICAHSLCLLPTQSQLVLLLPNESYLAKIFGFKAKHITEVENRLKFLLRSCTSAEIEKMGFRDVDVLASR
jgi:hypothetical protein